MARKPKRKPHFFKILLGDFSQRLRIPPTFVKYITPETSKKATLEGPNGSIWHVKLDKSLNGTFFQAGWPEFVKDHSLQAAEFLVFRYNGNLHFTVQVFGVNACERENLLTAKASQKPIFCKGKKKQGKVVTRSLEFTHISHLENYKNISKKQGKHGLRASQQSINLNSTNSEGERGSELPQVDSNPFFCTEGKNKVEHVSSDMDDETSFKLKASVDPGTSSAPIVKSQRVLSPETNGFQQMKVGIASRSSIRNLIFTSTRRPVTEEERARTWKEAYSLKPSYPYFITVMKVSNVYRSFVITIPRSFSRTYLPKVKSDMVFHDPRGKAWKMIYSVYTKQCDSITGGWCALSIDNNLEEGDICVFELIKKYEMCIHIFRVVQELTPLIKIRRQRKHRKNRDSQFSRRKFVYK